MRTGQTEGSVDLARLAGLKPAGVICEVMKDDGTMARMADLEIFAKEHNLKIVTIADLIDFRMQHESLIRRAATANLPSRYGGTFKIIVYENDVDDMKHIALAKGDIGPEDEVLVRCIRNVSLVISSGRSGAIAATNSTGPWRWLKEAARCHCLHASGRPWHRVGQ